MIILGIIFSILIPLLLGEAIILLINRKQKLAAPLERLALDYSLGIGLITLYMFTLALLKIPLSFINISTLPVLFSLVIFVFGIIKKYNFISFKNLYLAARSLLINKEKNKLLFFTQILLILAIFLKIFYIFFSAIVKPLVDIDAIQGYSLVAKGVFIEKTFLTPYLLEFIGDKPLFSHLSQAWVAISINTWNDGLIKIIAPLLFISLLIIFYYQIRESATKLYSLFFTFFLSSFPFITYHATTAYADFPQTFYYAAGTLYLFKFMRKKSIPVLLLSFVLLSISIFVKRGGIFLFFINLAVLSIYVLINYKQFSRKEFKYFMGILAIFFIIISPWLIYSQISTFRGLITAVTTDSSQNSSIIQGIDKINLIINTALRKLFLYADWHLLYFAFIMICLFFPKEIFIKYRQYLFLIIIFNILALFIQFERGGSFTWLLDGTLFDRLVMYHTPLVLFFIGDVLAN